MRRRHLLPALASAFALAAAAPDTKPISPARIKQHVRVLASDAFEGRGPTQAGEAKTVAYLARQMAQAGLRPGGPNGSWYQDVTLVRLDREAVTMAVTVGGETMQLRPGEEVTASSSAPGHTRLRNAPIVFGGYGVVSDELGWDPYRGADLKDKVVLLLWGDPDVEAGRDLGFGGPGYDLERTPGSQDSCSSGARRRRGARRPRGFPGKLSVVAGCQLRSRAQIHSRRRSSARR
jgi:hypothetical protein